MAEFTIRTYHKKSCEQVEYYYNRRIPGAKIIVRDGFRSAEFLITTTDDNFPEFEFEEVPGGDGKVDSLDLFSVVGDNIEDSELIEMFDGGHWGGVEIIGVDSEVAEQLQGFIDDNGVWALEEQGDWYLSDTECWVWGPLEVTDELGNIRIIVADDLGNVVDFSAE